MYLLALHKFEWTSMKQMIDCSLVKPVDLKHHGQKIQIIAECLFLDGFFQKKLSQPIIVQIFPKHLIHSLSYLVLQLIQNMTSDETARNIRSKIDETTTKPDSYYGSNISLPYDSGTSHLSIIAEDGSAVAVTSSINDM